MDPKRKRLEVGPTCRPTQRGKKNRVRPLGLHAAVFYARGAKWTTFFGVTAADGLLFLASGPHSLIFFYIMDPKRKRSETGPHSGLHSGKKDQTCGRCDARGTHSVDPKKIVYRIEPLVPSSRYLTPIYFSFVSCLN